MGQLATKLGGAENKHEILVSLGVLKRKLNMLSSELNLMTCYPQQLAAQNPQSKLMQAIKAANQHFNHVPNARTATEALYVSSVRTLERVCHAADTDLCLQQGSLLSLMQQRSTHRNSATMATLGHARLSYRQMAIYGRATL